MKAIVFHEYGSPHVLQLKEVETPAPTDDQVLVRIHAASANPLDWHRMRGEPFIARMDGGLRKPKGTRLGADIAGRVEAVGRNITQLRPGDDVFGEIGAGGFAEYVCVREDQVTLKPSNVSFEQAAAAPVAAFTALQGLRDKGQIQRGEKVLVNGASGGVGSFAVQIAKSYGTEVSGVCSTRNLDLVRSMGADHAIDYTREDFTNNGRTYDLIYDAIGNRSVSDYKRALNPQGRCVIAGFTSMSRLFEHMVIGPMRSKKDGQKVGLMGIANANKKDLDVIKELLETGKILPVIDRRYSLCETAEAIRYLETCHARGKVIITMDPDRK